MRLFLLSMIIAAPVLAAEKPPHDFYNTESFGLYERALCFEPLPQPACFPVKYHWLKPFKVNEDGSVYFSSDDIMPIPEMGDLMTVLEDGRDVTCRWAESFYECWVSAKPEESQ